MKKIKLLILVSVLFNPMVVLSQMTPREIYQKNVNSVVLIITKNKDGSKSKGTGAVIGESRVITNAHVVLEEGDQLPEKILIFLREDNINDESDKSYRRGRSGRIIRFDSDLDLALLEVKGIKSVHPIYLSDSECHGGRPGACDRPPRERGALVPDIRKDRVSHKKPIRDQG